MEAMETDGIASVNPCTAVFPTTSNTLICELCKEAIIEKLNQEYNVDLRVFKFNCLEAGYTHTFHFQCLAYSEIPKVFNCPECTKAERFNTVVKQNISSFTLLYIISSSYMANTLSEDSLLDTNAFFFLLNEGHFVSLPDILLSPLVSLNHVQQLHDKGLELGYSKTSHIIKTLEHAIKEHETISNMNNSEFISMITTRFTPGVNHLSYAEVLKRTENAQLMDYSLPELISLLKTLGNFKCMLSDFCYIEKLTGKIYMFIVRDTHLSLNGKTAVEIIDFFIQEGSSKILENITKRPKFWQSFSAAEILYLLKRAAIKFPEGEHLIELIKMLLRNSKIPFPQIKTIFSDLENYLLNASPDTRLPNNKKCEPTSSFMNLFQLNTAEMHMTSFVLIDYLVKSLEKFNNIFVLRTSGDYLQYLQIFANLKLRIPSILFGPQSILSFIFLNNMEKLSSSDKNKAFNTLLDIRENLIQKHFFIAQQGLFYVDFQLFCRKIQYFKHPAFLTVTSSKYANSKLTADQLTEVYYLFGVILSNSAFNSDSFDILFRSIMEIKYDALRSTLIRRLFVLSDAFMMHSIGKEKVLDYISSMRRVNNLANFANKIHGILFASGAENGFSSLKPFRALVFDNDFLAFSSNENKRQPDK